MSNYSSSKFVKGVIVFELFLVCFILFSFANMFYEGYQLDQYIEQNEQEYQLMLQENQKKKEDYLYYSSVEYLDKIAKQNFNKINPGEKLLVVADDLSSETSILDNELLPESRERSNPEEWLDLFFGS